MGKHFETVTIYRGETNDNGDELLHKVQAEIADLVNKGKAPLHIVPIQSGGFTTAILIVTAQTSAPPTAPPPTR